MLQGPAYENLQRRKPRWGEDLRCRVRYGDLSVAPVSAVGRFSMPVGLECLHNLDVTAWILLNGDLSFRAHVISKS